MSPRFFHWSTFTIHLWFSYWPVFFLNDFGRPVLEKIQSISIQGQNTSNWVVFFQTEDGNNIDVGVNILPNNLKEKMDAEYGNDVKLVL